jgi:hypothetical protein
VLREVAESNRPTVAENSDTIAPERGVVLSETGSESASTVRIGTSGSDNSTAMQGEKKAPNGGGSADASAPQQLLLPRKISKTAARVNKIPTPNLLEVKDLKDLVSRLPSSALKLPWKKIQGGAEDGVKWKWMDTDGNKWEVRAHSMDSSAPSNSNASQGWVYRVELKPANLGGKWQMANGKWTQAEYSTKVT